MQQITPAELNIWINTATPFALIDVREIWERAQYHIGGTHIPMGELHTRAKEIPKDLPVILYCEKGIRSVIAIQRLETMGFNNLYNLAGGMNGWKQAERE